ncbi:MAG: hypothetical protein HY721_08205 [Planctomycetes bacterium]|nr:hypothetical protein [Planctomycetota bacterium]
MRLAGQGSGLERATLPLQPDGSLAIEVRDKEGAVVFKDPWPPCRGWPQNAASLAGIKASAQAALGKALDHRQDPKRSSDRSTRGLSCVPCLAP